MSQNLVLTVGLDFDNASKRPVVADHILASQILPPFTRLTQRGSSKKWPPKFGLFGPTSPTDRLLLCEVVQREQAHNAFLPIRA